MSRTLIQNKGSFEEFLETTTHSFKKNDLAVRLDLSNGTKGCLFHIIQKPKVRIAGFSPLEALIKQYKFSIDSLEKDNFSEVVEYEKEYD